MVKRGPASIDSIVPKDRATGQVRQVNEAMIMSLTKMIQEQETFYFGYVICKVVHINGSACQRVKRLLKLALNVSQ